MLDDIQKIVSLCKRRGFIFQSSEIYGGLNSCWDYGPLGIELKNTYKKLWWETMVRRQDVEGIDASILMHPRVWEASGHVQNFQDPLIDCKKCKQRYRADQISTPKCPNCGGELTEARMFNLMFKTFMGPVEDSASVVYLRPETAQGIYVNFQNVQVSMRQKIPFGIAQIGKAFRNEITPGNFTFRTREFEQMEMQYFIKAESEEEWMKYWKEERFNWYSSIGIKKENLQFHQHGKGELAHYAKDAYDIEYKFPFGWQEIEGIHNRSNYDLGQHQTFSKKNLQYFDEETKEKFLPSIIETSAGCDRGVLVLLIDAYYEDPANERVVLGFHPKVAPNKAAFLPLSKKEQLMEPMHKMFKDASKYFKCEYDEAGSIGKRYRRHDEIGTPYCVTFDFESVNDGKVTIRERDKMTQERVALEQVIPYIREKLD